MQKAKNFISRIADERNFLLSLAIIFLGLGLFFGTVMTFEPRSWKLLVLILISGTIVLVGFSTVETPSENKKDE